MSRLGSLHAIYFATIDHFLIQAFVYKWHPKTNSFHLPWGEMTITLCDVHVLFGLRVDGVAMYDAVTNTERKTYLSSKFGFASVDFRGKSKGFNHTMLERQARELRDMSDKPHQLIAATYILGVLGCVLLNNRSTTYIPLWAFDFVQDIDRLGEYAWGARLLAYLYKQLGEASRIRIATIGGCIALLQYWIYAHFPILAGGASRVGSYHGDSRWAR